MKYLKSAIDEYLSKSKKGAKNGKVQSGRRKGCDSRYSR